MYCRGSDVPSARVKVSVDRRTGEIGRLDGRLLLTGEQESGRNVPAMLIATRRHLSINLRNSVKFIISQSLCDIQSIGDNL